MKVALLQTDPRPGDVAGNVATALDMVRQAGESGATLAILPEMWPRSYTDALDDPDADWAGILGQWQRACRDAGIWSLGGLPVQDGARWLNRCVVINPDGQVATHYDKIHLFSFMNEQKRYQPGDQVVTVMIDGVNIGLSICYDLRFPELYRALRGRGVDAMVAIAQWPTSRVDHWDALLRARAIENLCYMIGVNRCGSVPTSDGQMPFPGHSAVIDPWGESHWVAGSQPCIGYCILDAGNVAERRAGFPAWDDRRPDVLRVDP